jgi:hypothetical protein
MKQRPGRRRRRATWPPTLVNGSPRASDECSRPTPTGGFTIAWLRAASRCAPSRSPNGRGLLGHWPRRRAVARAWVAAVRSTGGRPLPFASQVAAPTYVLIEIFVLMVLTFLLTRKRVIPDIAARAPDVRVVWRETILVLTYAVFNRGSTPASLQAARRLRPSINRPSPNDSSVLSGHSVDP